ncbi:MAG: hypothetical protein WA139_05435 [Candidatus Aenigmatarchaeota archaeon]
MPNAKTVSCSALLVILMLSAYMYLQNYVYPQTVGKPFGGMIFFGAFSAVFTAVATISYLLLRVVLTSFSRTY